MNINRHVIPPHTDWTLLFPSNVRDPGSRKRSTFERNLYKHDFFWKVWKGEAVSSLSIKSNFLCGSPSKSSLRCLFLSLIFAADYILSSFLDCMSLISEFRSKSK